MIVSPLSELHHAIDDATFGDFGGIEIVTSFGDAKLEYAALHQRAGLIDAPWRGVLEIAGKDRHEFLGNLITNKTYTKATKAGIAAGEGVRAFFLNLKGRVVADLTLIERGESLLIDMDRRLVGIIAKTLDKYVFSEKVTFADRSTSHARLSLVGPGAAQVVYDAGGVDVSTLKPLQSRWATMFGVSVDVWRDDVTPATGLQLFVARERAETVWKGLTESFADDGRVNNNRRLRRVGWAALNAARIEAGRPMLGIDYEPAPPSVPGKKPDPNAPEEPAATKGILAPETGQFDTHVDVTKGCYLGQEIVARMYARKVVARQLVGFRMTGDALPIAGAGVFSGETQVGLVTSSTQSPVLSNACIGLALVKRPAFEIGSKLTIDAEGERRDATVVTTPFVARVD